MNIIQQNLHNVRQKIYTYAYECGRDPEEITLIAVSKTQSIKAIETAVSAGQKIFGENYVKEGVEKILFFNKKHPDLNLIWHFIGPLQSNKTKLIAKYFDWCDTLDRPKVIYRLNNYRPIYKMPLNVLIQINISGERTKSGIAPNLILPLATLIVEQPRLRLRGLMVLPKPECDLQQQLTVFKKAYSLYNHLRHIYSSIDTLSLGMSQDMQTAIAAGSTMIRIGTAIFGERKKLFM